MQSAFNFGHKDAITTNLREWHIRNTITGCVNLLYRYLKIGPLLAQPLDYPVCLYHCELAGSCADCDLLYHHLLPNRINSA